MFTGSEHWVLLFKQLIDLGDLTLLQDKFPRDYLRKLIQLVSYDITVSGEKIKITAAYECYNKS